MTPEEHTALINAVLSQPLACIEVTSDLVKALTRVREILASFPRPALEQIIAVVNRDNDRIHNSEVIRTAMEQITARLDALYTLL
jgi:hypothetical protein